MEKGETLMNQRIPGEGPDSVLPERVEEKKEGKGKQSRTRKGEGQHNLQMHQKRGNPIQERHKKEKRSFSPAAKKGRNEHCNGRKVAAGRGGGKEKKKGGELPRLLHRGDGLGDSGEVIKKKGEKSGQISKKRTDRLNLTAPKQRRWRGGSPWGREGRGRRISTCRSKDPGAGAKGGKGADY